MGQHPNGKLTTELYPFFFSKSFQKAKPLIHLNHKTYSSGELLQLTEAKLAQASPWEKDIFEFLRQWFDTNDHVWVHTSGSTGTPKAIRLKKSWMEYSARQTCSYFGITSASTALLCLPAAYIAGRMMLVRAIISGCHLISSEPVGNPFQKYGQQVDFAAVTPYQLHQSVTFLQEKPLAKTLIVGGGEISIPLARELQKISAQVYATYGMTETSSHIALQKMNGHNKEDCYTVLGNTQIAVDHRQCLNLVNPQLFEGVLQTNDVAEIISAEKFHWKGRYDHIINSGGIKIIPEETEMAIAHLWPGDMAISSVPDPGLGEKLVWVVEADQLPSSQEKSMLQKARSILNQYATPRQIFCIPKLPRTANTKLDRKALKIQLQHIC